MRSLANLVRAASAAAALVLVGVACGSTGAGGAAAAAVVAGAEKFADVARVLRHPRCLNCHPSGDRPQVGDDRRVHAMNVVRGPGGHGFPGMQCSGCHQPRNQDDAFVPGAPGWHLAPASMGWQGLDDHDLAEAIKDRTKNGGRSLAELRRHLAEDPLVVWGWNPGVGRAPVPMAHAAFVAAFDAWVAAGAASPAPGAVSRF